MSDPKLASPLTRRTRAVARQRVNGTTGDIDPDFVHDIAWTYPRFSHNICLTGSAICTNIGGAWAARHELLRRRGRLRDKCPHPTKILILEDDNPPRIYSKFVSRTKPGSREHALKLMKKFRALLAENRPTIDIGLSQPVI